MFPASLLSGYAAGVIKGKKYRGSFVLIRPSHRKTTPEKEMAHGRATMILVRLPNIVVFA